MASYVFHLVNVFAEQKFDGNPLCVFEDARGLSDEHMLLLTRQFNLSETTFILPPDHDDAVARVRVFTPGYEMPFAGHPTLGSAHVVRDLLKAGDRFSLSFTAGRVEVDSQGGYWSLRPPASGAPTFGMPSESPELLADLLGLTPNDLAAAPCWVDSGAHQLLIPVRDADAVDRAAFDLSRVSSWPRSNLGRQTAYVFAMPSSADWARFAAGESGNAEIYARYFLTTGAGVGEDPGTGSACANLGAWLTTQAGIVDAAINVSQGVKMGRPCRLMLTIDATGGIRVGGQVIPVGRGSVEI